MSTKMTAYSNPNATGVQKRCPKCYKINFGDVDVCGGCGADLSQVKTEGAGIRNAGLFGFMPAGAYLGEILGTLPYSWIIIPVGALMGYLVVKAEPAVYVLMRQVEDLTDGASTGRSLQLSM